MAKFTFYLSADDIIELLYMALDSRVYGNLHDIMKRLAELECSPDVGLEKPLIRVYCDKIKITLNG